MVLVAVDQTRTVEFVTDKPDDRVMHCHMTHHTMNQIGPNVPNLVGVRAADEYQTWRYAWIGFG
jgi:hypothetical protein